MGRPLDDNEQKGRGLVPGQAEDGGLLHFKASQLAVFIFTLDLGGHLLFFIFLSEKRLRLGWVEHVPLGQNGAGRNVAF